MKAVIVDDERRARLELRRLLEIHPEIEILGEAHDVASALTLIQQHSPELIFLDVQMPGATGFDLVAQLRAPLPRIIFTTAHDQHALRAFEVNALDYLLKPIVAARLAQALNRAVPSTIIAAEPTGIEESLLRITDRVFLRSADRAWLISVAEIQLLESEGNYTRVRFQQETPLIHRPLTALETRLPADIFLRANRSQIVNLQAIKTVTPWFSGSLKATLNSGETVEFSRRQAQLFRERNSL